MVVFSSCVDKFLEKPDTSGNIDLDKVYSSTDNATEALAAAYRESLIHGMTGGWGAWHGTLGSISGERAKGWSWHATWDICDSGLKVSNVLNSKDGTDSAGADSFKDNWNSIRASYIIKENIDRVPDMTAEMKGYIKAEATALIAYRYMGMFYRYGGLPIVEKAYQPGADFYIKRASLENTLLFILDLCQEAYDGLPNQWENKFYGRMTKGAVLAIKARTLQFAARPLFNSATPYLSSADNSLICFGANDPQRWQDAIDAHEAVLGWALANNYALINTGGAGDGQPNPKAMDDYGTAVSLPGNREVILAYKNDDPGADNLINRYNNMSPYYDGANRFETEQVGLLTNCLENYYLQDGTDPTWPKVSDPSASPASLWMDNMAAMEPRFKADYVVPYVNNSYANPGDPNWGLNSWYRLPANVFNEDMYPGIGRQFKGCGFSSKFYYGAGGRVWFEMPLFRLAETYLSLAEAYNEYGNTGKALENLNKVHNRAGLPAITQTDQSILREMIWREKSIEFVAENHRYFDVKHWKHPRIAAGIIGGQMRELQFQANTGIGAEAYLAGALIKFWDANSYNCYWHDKMFLEPIPQTEINKGYLMQNPGY